MRMYSDVLFPFVSKLSKADAEPAHELSLAGLSLLGRMPPEIVKPIEAYFTYSSPRLEQTLWNLRFRNPFGVGAGFDKNGVALGGLQAIGFGFLEMGTVTRYNQPGNPRPRMLRLPRERALLNSMGFNNDGADIVAANRQLYGGVGVPLGINIGLSKRTNIDDAISDYLYTLERVYPYADYFVINVSSPNTKDLRSLQDRRRLKELLQALLEALALMAEKLGRPRKLLFLKIAPDLTVEEINDIVDVCRECGVGPCKVDGIIATNTTKREGIQEFATKTGGLSGVPLFEASLRVVKTIRTLARDMPIIAVGGISSADDAYDMFKAGATLCQVYTGLVYNGPGFIRDLNRDLDARLAREGVEHVSQLAALSPCGDFFLAGCIRQNGLGCGQT